MPTAPLADVRLHFRIDGDDGAPPLMLSRHRGFSRDAVLDSS